MALERYRVVAAADTAADMQAQLNELAEVRFEIVATVSRGDRTYFVLRHSDR